MAFRHVDALRIGRKTFGVIIFKGEYWYVSGTDNDLFSRKEKSMAMNDADKRYLNAVNVEVMFVSDSIIELSKKLANELRSEKELTKDYREEIANTLSYFIKWSNYLYKNAKYVDDHYFAIDG